MAITVVFVSGPRRGGKSQLIEQLVSNCFSKPPHYLRLAAEGGDKCPPCETAPPKKEKCGVASAKWIEYHEDSVFECLSDVLHDIHRKDRKGFVIIEADADPILRLAHPYDFRMFVMPAPHRLTEVFRTMQQANTAFQSVMDDTTAFAGEILGLMEDRDKLSEIDPDASEKRDKLTARYLSHWFNSPIGEEVATRIMLQPSYHGLLEADVVVINTAVGGMSPVVDRCVRQLERVAAHVPGIETPKNKLFTCDPADERDPLRGQLFTRICKLLGCDCHTDNAAC